MNELEEFKQEIYNKVMDYDEGCNEGKFRFLQELGVQSPKKRIVVTIDVAGPQESADEFRDDLERSSIEELAYDYKVELIECSAEVVDWADTLVVGQRYNLAKTLNGSSAHIRKNDPLDASLTYCGVRALVDVPIERFDNREMHLCSNCDYNAPTSATPARS